MSFNPRTEYTTVSREFAIQFFASYKEKFVTRPPYQRKSVWSTKKKQSLMDSLFRRYYIPKLVIREVRLSDEETVHEIIDGQQRITTVQEFFEGEYPLPKSLVDVNENLAGAYYKDLDADIRIFIDTELKYQADIIKNIDDPKSGEHQITATEIFWRLQQGESLNYMEVAHAQLSSLTRNFIVKYADDQTFDFENYKAVDSNPDLHDFFSLLNFNNNRMKHLQVMARFVLIERGDGHSDLSDKKIEAFINNERQKKGGIGNFSFEEKGEAKATLKTLQAFYNIFKNDPIRDAKSGVIKELSIEYFIISIYSLIRHVNKYYVMDEAVKTIIREFVHHFHPLWKNADISEDTDLLTFSNNRQQGEKDLRTRDMILRQIFFQYLKDNNKELIAKDTNRAFSELERITIYRRGKGICQKCVEEGKPENETIASWSEYHADHVIPHSKGGQTTLENAQLLCRYHNQSKGAL